MVSGIGIVEPDGRGAAFVATSPLGRRLVSYGRAATARATLARLLRDWTEASDGGSLRSRSASTIAPMSRGRWKATGSTGPASSSTFRGEWRLLAPIAVQRSGRAAGRSAGRLALADELEAGTVGRFG